jgi:hypothetical protein
VQYVGSFVLKSRLLVGGLTIGLKPKNWTCEPRVVHVTNFYIAHQSISSSAVHIEIRPAECVYG